MHLSAGQGTSKLLRMTGLLCLSAILLCHHSSDTAAQESYPPVRSIWDQTAPGTKPTKSPNYSAGFHQLPPASRDSSAHRSEIQPTNYEQRSAAAPTTQPGNSSPLSTLPQQQEPARLTSLPTETAEAVIPLTRPTSGIASNRTNSPPRSSGSQLGLTVVVLAGVVTLILVLAKLVKKHSPITSTALPGDVLELLGRRPLDQRHAIHFVRIGQRILVLGVSIEGVRTLTEITDPVEIDRISGQCRTDQTESTLVRSFRMLLSRQTEEVPHNNSEELPRRQRQRRKNIQETVHEPPAYFSWETPDDAQDSGITSDDIASLTRTLETARERRE